MNPGGIRADLACRRRERATSTYGEAFTVQPFNNYVVSIDMTGAQINDLLEQQFPGANAGRHQDPAGQSTGFTYSYSASAPAGSKVDRPR